MQLASEEQNRALVKLRHSLHERSWIVPLKYQPQPPQPHLVVELDTSRIEHYSFVGECLSDYWGIQEFRLSIELKHSHKHIMALH